MRRKEISKSFLNGFPAIVAKSTKNTCLKIWMHWLKIVLLFVSPVILNSVMNVSKVLALNAENNDVIKFLQEFLVIKYFKLNLYG